MNYLHEGGSYEPNELIDPGSAPGVCVCVCVCVCMDTKMVCLSELDTFMDCFNSANETMVEKLKLVGDLRRRQKTLHVSLIDAL